MAWLLASLWISLPRVAPLDDEPEWKLPELHDPYARPSPERARPQPLPPEDELKLRDLKPPPER